MIGGSVKTSEVPLVNGMKHRRKKAARWTPGLKKLKAISIRQPWAWLIVNGYKDVENRVWAAKLRGPVLIHAGQSKSDTTPEALGYIKRKYHVANLPDTFETDGIVGIAEITDCVQSHRSKWFQGPFGWTLANARRLPFKPVKGHLKFFTPKI